MSIKLTKHYPDLPDTMHTHPDISRHTPDDRHVPDTGFLLNNQQKDHIEIFIPTNGNLNQNIFVISMKHCFRPTFLSGNPCRLSSPVPSCLPSCPRGLPVPLRPCFLSCLSACLCLCLSSTCTQASPFLVVSSSRLDAKLDLPLYHIPSSPQTSYPHSESPPS